MARGNLKDALTLAYAAAPCGVAYYQGKGWAHYSLKTGPGDGKPDFWIIGQGKIPVPLNDDAAESWRSLLHSLMMGR